MLVEIKLLREEHVLLVTSTKQKCLPRLILVKMLSKDRRVENSPKRLVLASLPELMVLVEIYPIKAQGKDSQMGKSVQRLTVSLGMALRTNQAKATYLLMLKEHGHYLNQSPQISNRT
jgi:hypothetical protein